MIHWPGVAQPKDGDNSCKELQGKEEVDISTCWGHAGQGWKEENSENSIGQWHCWAIELSIKSSCIVQGGLGWKAGLQEQVQRFDKHVSDWISIEHGSSFLCFTPRIARWEWRTNEFAHRCKPSILRSQFLNADGSESSLCDCLVLPKQSCQDYFRCKFAWSYSSTALCPSIPICSTIVIPIFNI